MKKKLFLSLAILFIGLVVFCQAADSTIVPALVGLGVSKTVAWLISSVLAFIVGQWVIPQAWTAPLIYVEKVLYMLYSLVRWINEKTNKLSKKQKSEMLSRAVTDDSAFSWKKVITPIVIMMFAVGVNAQSFEGFFGSTDQAVKEVYCITLKGTDTTAYSVTLFRPSVMAVGYAVDLSESPLTSSAITAFGIGVSWGKYGLVNGKAYCKIAVNASLFTNVNLNGTTAAKIGPGATVGLFDNLLNVGFAYIDKSPLLLFGVAYTF